MSATIGHTKGDMHMKSTQEVIIAGIWRATSQNMLDAHLIVMRNHLPEPWSHEWFQMEATKAEVIENNFVRILH